MNNKITFNELDLRWLLTLAKDRKFKVEMGDLHYSTTFLLHEKKILGPLISKLEISLEQIRSKMVQK